MSQRIFMIDPTPFPVYALAEKWGKDEGTLATWCAKGWIKGAFKMPNGQWFVRPLELAEVDEKSIVNTSVDYDGAQAEECRDRRKNQKPVLRKMDGRKKTRLRQPAPDVGEGGC